MRACRGPVIVYDAQLSVLPLKINLRHGPLAYLLRNRFYVGEVVYRGKVCPAEHPPILDRDLFEAVQAQLARQHRNFVNKRTGSQALLLGKLFDNCGNRMSPSHASKKGVRYRYYVSAALAQTRPEEAGPIRRVVAAKLEGQVLRALRDHHPNFSSVEDRELIERCVDRIVLGPTTIVITLHQADLPETANGAGAITIPWVRTAMKRQREILLPEGEVPDHRPIRAETRATLVRSIALGRRWLGELVNGTMPSTPAIAQRESCSQRHVERMLSLAFLAPDLVRAAVEGRLPRGVGVSRLIDLPTAWPRQWQMLGLPS